MKVHKLSSETIKVPFFLNRIPAGYPAQADGHLEKRFDLNCELVPHPDTTFCVRVEGASMKEAGIETGDILVVDRALEPQDGRVVVCAVHGDFTVKRLSVREDRVLLLPANNEFPEIEIFDETALIVWGTVTYVIKKM